jgi:hypothetical protein
MQTEDQAGSTVLTNDTGFQKVVNKFLEKSKVKLVPI